MPTNKDKLKSLMHQQLSLILKAFLKNDSPLVDPEFELTNEAFLKELDTAFTSVIYENQNMPISNRITLSRVKYEIVKSHIVIWQTKIIISDSSKLDTYLSLKDDFLYHLAKILNSYR